MLKTLFLLLALVSSAMASTDRILDGKFITNGSATLTLPTSTTTMVGRDTTDTLTNKSLSGSSNTFTNIPTGAIAGSALSGSNSGDVTLGTASGLSLSGQQLSLGLSSGSTTGALSSSDWTTFNGKLSSALTTNHIFVGASGSAADVAMSGDASIVASGALTLATVNSNVGSFTNANITVNAKGLITAASSGTGVAPGLSGTQASPTLITAVGGVGFSGSNYSNIAFIAGNGGAVTVTANPQIAAASAVGQRLTLITKDATNTVTLSDGTGLSLNGPWVGALDSVLTLVWDGASWVEESRR